MKRDFRYFIIIMILCCWSGFRAEAQSDSTEAANRILVVGFDTTQFYSNVFYLGELAYYNNTDTNSVVETYKKKVLEVLKYHNSREYKFVVADSADQHRVFRSSVYLEVENDFGTPFIGIAAGEDAQGQLLTGLMEKYNANYLLTLNAYEIFKKNPPEYVSYSTKTEHLIHYDFFNKELNSMFSGKIPLTSFANEAYFMVSRYQEFGDEILLRLKAYNLVDNKARMMELYAELKERDIKNRTGLGLSLGFGAPYGLFGIEISRYISSSVDINAGLGYDFNGFKIGAGTRIYLIKFDQKIKPFLGLNYAYATGSSFELGGEFDEFGNQIDPDDISQIEIFSDHAIHFSVGGRYLLENQAFMLRVGYSFPFQDKNPIVRGNESQSRRNFADAMAVGGLDINFTYVHYLTKKRPVLPVKSR